MIQHACERWPLSRQGVPQEAVAGLPRWHVPPGGTAVQPLSLLSRRWYWRFRLSAAVANGGILVPAVVNGGTSFPAGNNGGIHVQNKSQSTRKKVSPLVKQK